MLQRSRGAIWWEGEGLWRKIPIEINKEVEKKGFFLTYAKGIGISSLIKALYLQRFYI